MSNQLRLHLIECSLKDAGDLVHALLGNLGSTEAALSIPPSAPADSNASNLLRTCKELTRLLAGAVEMARRDACSDMPKPKSVPLPELLQLIVSRISSKFLLYPNIFASSDLSNVIAQIDPEVVAYAVERVSDDVCARSGLAARMSSRFNGGTATISLHWLDPCSLGEPREKKAARNGERLEDFRPGRKYAETIATCRALLARQGVEIDVGLDEWGNLEVAIALPARIDVADLTSIASDVGIHFAEEGSEMSSPAEHDEDAGRKRSGIMIIQSDRFGSIDVDAQEILDFPHGIIGFADEHQFVMVRTNRNSAVGWLQSATTPNMALPVVSAHVLVPKYPDVDIVSYAEAAGLGQSLDELAVLVVLNAPPGIPATVNLVAPIIVNATTRKGAQLLLEGSRFTTREIFMLPAKQENAAQSDAQAATTAAE
jgi:flagellar assembly factor FliW